MTDQQGGIGREFESEQDLEQSDELGGGREYGRGTGTTDYGGGTGTDYGVGEGGSGMGGGQGDLGGDQTDLGRGQSGLGESDWERRDEEGGNV